MSDGVGKPRQPKRATYTPQELAAADQVLSDLNRRAGTRFRALKPNGMPTGGAAKVIARLREGYAVRDLRLVVWDRTHPHEKGGWLHDPKMEQHLTPETLFAPEKFETRVAVAKKAHEDTTGKPEKDPEPAQPMFRLPGLGGGAKP